MIRLKDRYAEHDARAMEFIRETFERRNKNAAVVIYDANFWTFGETLDDIPEDYYGDDPAVMTDYQLGKIERHYGCYYNKDCFQGFRMPWYGTNIVKNYRADPAVDISRVKSPDEVRKLKMPDPDRDGLMPQVLKTLRYFRAHCDLPVGVTDCQGPLTTALSVIGYDNFCCWMYDDPNVIHELMDKVTVALIEWVKVQKTRASIPMEGGFYALGVRMPDGFGGVWISDDDSVMIGAEHYRKFVVPYNSRILRSFGSGCIHYCGDASQHIENYLSTEGLTAVNNLYLDNLDAASRVRKALAAKGIVYIACDFILTDRRLAAYYRDLFDAMGDQRGLIIVAYVAPAVELEKGRYTESRRDQFELGKRVRRVIDEEMVRT